MCIKQNESTDGQSAPQNRIHNWRDCDCFLGQCPKWRNGDFTSTWIARHGPSPIIFPGFVAQIALHECPSSGDSCYRAHLGWRCSVHLCRSNASSTAFEGTLGVRSSRWTNGCDHAQSEHFQFAELFVGPRILRAVSVIHSTLCLFPKPNRTTVRSRIEY